ncbi:MAG: hypothetical protein MJY63_01560 [Paludibacteraceae bacterium]|nr:hypothetical protein [Paludibacteraceae bacterium]
MVNKSIFTLLLAAFAFITQSCSEKKETKSEAVLKISNSEEFTSFVNDYNSGKFHLNDSLISPLTVDLECDISIVNNSLSPIGSEEFPFIGTFNGNGHTITCCQIGKSKAANNVGLIGYAKDSKIKGITVITEKVIGQRSVGIICGYAYRTCISDCKTSGNVTAMSCCGGIAGSASYGGVSDCHFVGNVTASECLAGGIVGLFEFGGILRSYAGGQVSAKRGVSPITSSNQDDVMVSDCIDRMNVVITNENDNVKRKMASDKLTRLLFEM